MTEPYVSFDDENGHFDRRAVLLGIAALGAGTLVGWESAVAQASEIVIATFGGDSQAAFDKIWVEPFRQNNPGLKIAMDGSGPSSGKIKAMVESGAVKWNICERNLIGAQDLGEAGLLAEVDWSIVDRNKVRPEHSSTWGVGNYLISNVLAYDSKVFATKAPKTWADFWNVKEFPGRRMLRKNVEGSLEVALLADGVDPKKLYPLDVNRALEKVKEIKQHTIFWDSAASSQQILRDGDAVMGNIWSTRASVVRKDTAERVTYSFNQALIQAAAWIVPKGHPGGKDVWRFIASTQDPKSQIELFKLIGAGPINPAASELVPAELRALNPGDPANIAIQVPLDHVWYAKNYASVVDKYLAIVSS